MRVSVLGLWHLGSVSAVCSAGAGHDVVGWDPDPSIVSLLAAGNPPVSEPGLAERLRAELQAGRLRFTDDLAAAVKAREVVWVAFDTPVDANDLADAASVLRQVERAFPHISDGSLVLCSSQLPVGSVAALEAEWSKSAMGRDVGFACSPENLVLGQSLDAFTKPNRVVIGLRRERDRAKLLALFAPITDRLEWMSVESAELTKHAINAFLATSVAFINEIAALAEQVGADAAEVERGLKTERRIGPHAYLSPGAAFAGGTLARDITFLHELGRRVGRATPLLEGVQLSNTSHRGWPERQLAAELSPLAGRHVAMWGLTYKPGTDTLRRSSAVELGAWLLEQGARVTLHDPAAGALPPSLAAAAREQDAVAALRGAEALVVSTEWPLYRQIGPDEVVRTMLRPLVIDANRFLGPTLGADQRIRLISVGQPRTAGGRSTNPQTPNRPAGRVSHSLAGRAAIITGASQGLGLEIARAYVRSGAGVMLCARDRAKLLQAQQALAQLAGPGQSVEAMAADVSVEADVRALVDASVARFGQIHVLVNNAGVYGPMGPIDAVDWAGWIRALEINVLGSVLPCRLLLPHFKAHRYGKIVQLSGGGATSPLPRITAYAASKAAIVRFAESLAHDVREYGIDVNAIAPGALNTRMMSELLAAGPEAVGGAFYSRMKTIADEGGTPLEKGAELAVFLGSAASDGLTGRLLSAVWDPWEELLEHRDDLEKSDIYTLRRIVPEDRGRGWGRR